MPDKDCIFEYTVNIFCKDNKLNENHLVKIRYEIEKSIKKLLVPGIDVVVTGPDKIEMKHLTKE